MGTTLVIAAHPDDEVLGCGGTLAKWANAGEDIFSVAVADGVGSRPNPPETAEERIDVTERALARLGVRGSHFFNLPDQRLDEQPLLSIVELISERVSFYGPSTVITHSVGDLNRDHQITAEATLVACRPTPGSTVVRMLHFEVPSATGWRHRAPAFEPNYWVDINETLTDKLDALRLFEAEMRPWPHVRSLEAISALAQWRGASVGLPAAESFEISRWAERQGEPSGR